MGFLIDIVEKIKNRKMPTTKENIIRVIKVLGDGLPCLIYDFQFMSPAFNIQVIELTEDENDYTLSEYDFDKWYEYPSDMLTEADEIALLKELEDLI